MDRAWHLGRVCIFFFFFLSVLLERVIIVRDNIACRSSCSGSCTAVVFDPVSNQCYKGPADTNTFIAGEEGDWKVGAEPWLFSSFDDSLTWEATTSVQWVLTIT